jgi:NOL1/NOP2/fmu family ribosome biogenesis protein
MSDERDGSTDDERENTEKPAENVGTRFDRLPATAAERVVEGRVTREAVLAWWDERFGIDSAVFEEHTFWERGAGKVWVFRGEVATPADIEGLGMVALRTRQEHWKPTLEAAQRFGSHVSKNCIGLSRSEASTFLAGEDQHVEWDGDWGYLIVTHDLAGVREPLGVGLYIDGELRSMVPKGRRREL